MTCFRLLQATSLVFLHYLFFIIKQFMNKIVILNDSVQLYEHYISDDRWEKTLAFPRGGLTYLISNGTIKFYAYEDYLYRNTLMSMQLPVHVIDDYAGIDDDLSDMDELTEALDRVFPTNDIDAELNSYLTKDEALDTYQLKGDYALKSEIPDVSDFITDEDLVEALDDYYTKDETDDLLEGKQDASGMTDYYTKGETNEAISAAIDEAVSGKADTSAVTAISDALTAHTADTGIHVSQQEKEAWNAKLDASAYTPCDLSDYYTKQETNGLLDNKLDASAYTPCDLSDYWTSAQTQSAITQATSGMPSQQDIETLSGDVETLKETKLDASAYTPCDLSQYWTSAETQSAITQATSGIPSSQTIEGLRNDINTISGDVETIKNTYVTQETLRTYITAIQQLIYNLSDQLEECCSGDTPTPPAPTGETQYRTVSGTPYCDGYSKKVDVTEQVSHDSGQTWANISTRTEVVEEKSPDCGFTDYMFYGTKDDGTHVMMECNGSGAINDEDTLGKLNNVVEIVVGECVNTIGSYAFDRSTISAITLPNTITTIGQAAFMSTPITSITIPSGVTSIGASAFDSCTGLTSLSIPTGVSVINISLCENCSSLQTLVLGENVTTIHDRAFRNCSSLQSVTINTLTPPTMVGYDYGAGRIFENTNNCPIYVPAASVEVYKAANGWSTLANRIQAIQ